MSVRAISSDCQQSLWVPKRKAGDVHEFSSSEDVEWILTIARALGGSMTGKKFVARRDAWEVPESAPNWTGRSGPTRPLPTRHVEGRGRPRIRP
jgi:hypothetical protein